MREPNDPAVVDGYHLASGVEQLKRHTKESSMLAKLLVSGPSEDHEVKGILQIRVRENFRDLVEFAVEIGPDLQRWFSTPPNGSAFSGTRQR